MVLSQGHCPSTIPVRGVDLTDTLIVYLYKLTNDRKWEFTEPHQLLMLGMEPSCRYVVVDYISAFAG